MWVITDNWSEMQKNSISREFAALHLGSKILHLSPYREPCLSSTWPKTTGVFKKTPSIWKCEMLHVKWWVLIQDWTNHRSYSIACCSFHSHLPPEPTFFYVEKKSIVSLIEAKWRWITSYRNPLLRCWGEPVNSPATAIKSRWVKRWFHHWSRFFGWYRWLRKTHVCPGSGKSPTNWTTTRSHLAAKCQVGNTFNPVLKAFPGVTQLYTYIYIYMYR